ncbi:MAG: 30S ribosomal protein S2 [Prevotella sp.]|jgi:small subunit ribosomal protein S2|uniref:30S ribosomal protein S2 n=1 Tax=Prevotella sp. Rep29 TaxID=2691580 RepID=UPI001C6E7B21|nr:30S ribosomal protein S2 [Prevotella sp. Rep29]MBQ3624564.1 30S ribosomal protein S2 [Prevotella sp.]MBR1656603.1 30S ribosomal protein S2 [Prevotella sp.]MBR3444380.1 30S ribosomal protein S2 [Prevotella sp.]MBR7014403.1 30S ribosomal protein S2 [Prevotella sp.]QYR11462.1 30S ribosomal protein S2 [Prevotella sp. Rep29]
MARTNFDQLLQAGCHFGHLRRKWNPAMAPYIFMERNGIHIIDLHKTVAKIDEAAEALKMIAKSGKKVLFVSTKKQAKEIVAEKAASVGMPYVIERWPGGMLTNFPTIRKAVKKMTTIDKLMSDGTYSNLSKRELLQITRQRAKLEKNLGSIADLSRLPSALFVIDVMKEHIAVKEANRLGIPVFGVVDTNSDPGNIDFVIPANDDAKDSIDVILTACCQAIAEGLEERKAEKADDKAAAEQGDEEAVEVKPKRARRARKEAPKAEEVAVAEAPKAEETPAAEEEAPAAE